MSPDSEDSELEEFTDNNVNAPKPLYPDASIYAKDSILSIMHPCFHGITVIIIIVNFIIATDSQCFHGRIVLSNPLSYYKYSTN